MLITSIYFRRTTITPSNRPGNSSSNQQPVHALHRFALTALEEAGVEGRRPHGALAAALAILALPVGLCLHLDVQAVTDIFKADF